MTENFTIPDVNTSDFDPFSGPAIERVAPATEPQLEIWLACLLGGENATRSYNLANSIRLEGRFDRAAMEKALQALVRRHDALRSVFSANGEHLFILKDIDLPIAYQNLSTINPDKQATLMAQYVTQNSLRIVNLAEGPVFRVALFKLAEQVHYLVLMSHHAVRDGWSMGILLQDLSTLYTCYAQGLTPNLPKAPSFARYAEDQLDFSKTDTYRATEAFWFDTYKDSIPLLELPTDYPRPAVHSFDSKRLDYPMDSELMMAVKTMGLKAGCSFVTTLLATFEVLLHRLSGQEDIIVGLPTAGQLATGNKRLVGHCVNLLPIRSHLASNLSFSEFLKECRRTVLDAYEHQQLPFSHLLRKLNVARDLSRTPFVSAVFNVDLGMNDGVSFYGLNHKLISHPKAYENFELFFNVSGSENALTLEWSYNTNLYKAETVHRMMTDFEQLLKTVVATPSIVISDISLSSERTRIQTMTRQLPAKTVYPRQTPVHQLIAQRALVNPTKIALSFNNQHFSYQSVNETANQLAHVLIQRGIDVGQVVGIALDRSPHMLIALLAVLKTGAAYLPLDPEYPTDRLTFMLTDSAATMLITQEKYQGRLSPLVSEVLIEQALTESITYPVDEPDRTVSGTDLAYILYTSGSTGKPKGVLIEHHSLVNFLWSMQASPGITPDDVLLAITTISFDIAGLELYLPLVAGATILLADTETARDGRALLDSISTNRVSIMQATPSTWRMLLDAGWNTFVPIKAFCGGEALPQDLAEKLLDRCHEVWNLYGPTETTIWSTVKKIAKNEPVTIGQPINNTQVYILDKFLRPVGPETVGELFIGGDGVARGYLNRPDLTTERFVKLVFDKQPERLLYRTGDLGKWLKNGDIQCLGRIDQQVKIRGHRIELGEIDNALLAINDIREAVVIAHADRPGEQRLIAYVVPESVSTSDPVGLLPASQRQTWQQALRQTLPDYMVPGEFIVLPRLPLTLNGKIDRKALPPVTRREVDVQSVLMPPRTDIEKLVAEIWTQCLQLDKISVLDNFFEMGGHSLIAVQIMTRLEKETGKRLPLSMLFECPTVEKLALALQMDGKFIVWDSLVPIKPQGTKTPLYIIHGAGLHVMLFNTLAKNMDADQPIYGLQAKGINGVDEPLSTIEDIAAYYITAIRTKNPDGPYALAGYSFGGIIAYEMCRQLKQAGKEVKILAMFDTHADQSNYLDPWMSKVWNNMQISLKKYLYTFVLLKNDISGTISYKKESIKRRVNTLHGKLKYTENYHKVFYGNQHRVHKSNQQATRNYRLTPQDVTVDLFRAEKRMYYTQDFEFLGWKSFAKGGVTVHKVPGDHASLFNPPNDKEFARVLQNLLDSRL